MWTIYMHQNKINNKAYIGITKRALSVRWGKDGRGYKDQPKFYNAILKYGWDNFSHKVIQYVDSEEEALELESFYINKYNTIIDGYNILSKGIKSYNKYTQKPVICLTTQTIYPSISNAIEQTNISGAYEIIKNCRGERGPVKGLEWAYWDNQLQRPVQKQEYVPKLQSNATPVYCIELNKSFPGVATAERELGITKGGIEKAINGHRNGANGLHFIKEKDKTEEKILELLKKKTGKTKRVVCLDDNIVFESGQKAAAYVNKSPQSIVLTCKGKRNTCGGKRFQYLEDYIDNNYNLNAIKALVWDEIHKTS